MIRLKKGQIIARLDDRDIVAQLDEAKSSLQLYQAQMNEVENNYNREKELFSPRTYLLSSHLIRLNQLTKSIARKH